MAMRRWFSARTRLIEREAEYKMATDKTDLMHNLRKAIRPQPSLVDVSAILKDFKNLGGTQAEALEVLEQLRSEAPDEEIEDCILEMMDIAAGWCNARLRVWEESSPS
jgi:hypothetical protein